MESLTTLATSLDANTTNTLEQDERALTKDFRAAALSITTLYKSSLQSSRRAYDSGYSACLNDVLNFIQQGVSASHISEDEDGWGHGGMGMSVGRVMDWVEARLEAVGTKEDDDPEDEEKPGRNHNDRPNPVDPVKTPQQNVEHIRKQTKDGVTSQVSRPISLSPRPRSATPPTQSSSSSPQQRPLPLPLPRRAKTRARSKESQALQPLSSSAITNTAAFTFASSTAILDNSALSDLIIPYPGLASKRKHNTMAVDHSIISQSLSSAGGELNLSTATSSRSSRRRNKFAAPRVMTTGPSVEAMDTEDEGNGRERKRQARR